MQVSKACFLPSIFVLWAGASLNASSEVTDWKMVSFFYSFKSYRMEKNEKTLSECSSTNT